MRLSLLPVLLALCLATGCSTTETPAPPETSTTTAVNRTAGPATTTPAKFTESPELLDPLGLSAGESVELGQGITVPTIDPMQSGVPAASTDVLYLEPATNFGAVPPEESTLPIDLSSPNPNLPMDSGELLPPK